MELRMNQKERDKLKRIEQVHQGLLGTAQAAQTLGLSQRQVQRIVKDYEARGDRAVVHGARGRRPNNAIAPAAREQARELLKTKYAGFGPTLAAEHLGEDDGMAVSRETVRGWMIEQNLRGGQRKKRPHRHRRPRRACFGELVQMDTSIHDWLEGRGPALALITMIDDATGRKQVRFFDADSTVTNMAMLALWIGRYGRPVALYTDWASHFKLTSPAGAKASQTQIERALGELDIRLIAAHSAQAKGRVERSHLTDQDRLIKEMRLLGISTQAAANRFLEEVYLPRMEKKFAVVPGSAVDAHRDGAGFDLEAILSVQEERRVANDYTVRADSVVWQIERGEITGGLRQSKVVVEWRRDGTMRLRWRDRYLKYHQAQLVCKIITEVDEAKNEARAGVGGQCC